MSIMRRRSATVIVREACDNRVACVIYLSGHALFLSTCTVWRQTDRANKGISERK